MKKLLSIFLCLMLLPLYGCNNPSDDNGKIQIVATLFPQYDFAREIGGDKVSVTLLLPPGQESHLYDPSPSDMALIAESDLFIYTGDAMEGWAGEIASSIGSSVTVLDVSEGIDIALTDDHEEHMDMTAHEHTLDPHIWLDFDNAKLMADNIAHALIALSPEHEEYFTTNLNNYKATLTALDEKYYEVFASYPDKDLIFGGRFALGYLLKRYNVSYRSAYDSCSANAEPSVQDISLLSDYVKENDIKVIYCEEFADPKVSREIASANDASVLVLHSCHNTSREERESNATFVSLMEQNLENIRKGLE